VAARVLLHARGNTYVGCVKNLDLAGVSVWVAVMCSLWVVGRRSMGSLSSGEVRRYVQYGDRRADIGIFIGKGGPVLVVVNYGGLGGSVVERIGKCTATDGEERCYGVVVGRWCRWKWRGGIGIRGREKVEWKGQWN
jgi:hypothetical protein